MAQLGDGILRRSMLSRPELELVLGREKFLENYFPDDRQLSEITNPPF